MIDSVNNIHVWRASMDQVLVSFEDTKRLYSFASKDDAIDTLFTLGFKDTARQLHNTQL